MHRRTILVVGASGVVGEAALRHFTADPHAEVIGVSRRPPVDLFGATHLSIDLLDGARCDAAFRALGDVTHLVYAAVHELPGLVAGWTDAGHRAANLTMFRNTIDPLVAAQGDLQHVTLLQGTKAYGVHLGATATPAKERWPRHPHENFYFDQEDHLRAVHRGASWSFSILRPQVVYGESLGSPMNLVPAIGVYGALRRARGLPLSFPGGATRVSEAVDADLLARAIDWCGTSDAARGETFNVTNGDVFTWRDVWPTIADVLGMEVGPDEPHGLVHDMAGRDDEWRDVVRSHALAAPDTLDAMVGDGFVYADLLFGHGVEHSPLPVLVSTVKIRQAGFAECVDTEDMFARLLRRMQDRALLPPARSGELSGRRRRR
jgi:nucleoside-diphosphate-sugar epimerase